MLSIFLIGLALSMDAFSLAIGIGTTNISNRNKQILSLMVAIMHFIMPNLGLYLGDQLFRFLEINVDILMIIIFAYLGITMFINRHETKAIVRDSVISYLIIAFSVSIDSFSIGLGLMSITDHHLIAALVFAFCSGVITYLGLLIGEYSIKLLEEKAATLGSIILMLLAIVNTIEHFFPFN